MGDTCKPRDGTWMDLTIDTENLEENRKVAAFKYLALALCLAIFVIYGLIAG